MNLSNFFKPRIKPISGVLPDVRPQEEKQKDYLTEEVISMATPINYVDWSTWKNDQVNIKVLNDIKVKFQNGVGSCAACAGATHLEINNYIEDGKYTELSPRSIYANRVNKPQAGMMMNNLADILTNKGAIPEVFCPSPHDTDANMSQLNDVISLYEGFGKLTRIKNHIWVLGNNIDTYAHVLSLGKPITYTVLFGEHEWGNELCPQLRDTVLPYGHANDFLATDKSKGIVSYQGKRCLVSQDSHGTFVGYGGRRLISEDWFNAGRVLFGIWTTDLQNLAIFNEQQATIKYQWTRDLYAGCMGDDVRMLQLALATIQDSEGYLFPLATQNATTYFGGITRNAVKRFQTKYGIEPVAGYCGPLTRAKLNELFK